MPAIGTAPIAKPIAHIHGRIIDRTRYLVPKVQNPRKVGRMNSRRPSVAQRVLQGKAGNLLPFGTKFEDCTRGVADPRHLWIEIDGIAVMILALPQRGDECAHLRTRPQQLAERRLAGRQRSHDDSRNDQECDADPDQIDIGGGEQTQGYRCRPEKEHEPSGDGQGLQTIATTDRANENIERDRCDAAGVYLIEQ